MRPPALWSAWHASHASSNEVLVAGLASLVAGAMSMAAGEHVSVSSQANTEAADLERERQELATGHGYEREELGGDHASGFQYLAISPDGRFLAAGTGGAVRRRDAHALPQTSRHQR